MVTGRIGVPAPRSMWSAGSEQFHTLVLRGIEETAIAEGHSVLSEVVDTLETELEVLRAWEQKLLVDVVILKDLQLDDPRPSLLREGGLPFVLAGDVRQTGTDAAVLTDNAGVMRHLLTDLLTLGHSRIGHIGGPGHLLHSQWRREAYAQFVGSHELPSLRYEGDYSAASGAQAARWLLALNSPPTVLVFDNDAMAIGGADLVRELGMKVPRDVSLVSWDDSLACRTYDPPLAVLGHRAHQLGITLGSVASDLLAGTGAGARVVEVMPVVSPRESLAAPLSV
ncbi:LacI family DNA-binding transcriptional regulator [Brachybacterium sp. FME24]|uniref:LacI family DNA-binding transcriptional regulator n=1 Tax=Brachybacterium sp. FME24 TaxID=2742605 RepID=UPI001868229A|nr:substrate-binding domain-containing protein [Brachybacterium sp. FME24]